MRANVLEGGNARRNSAQFIFTKNGQRIIKCDIVDVAARQQVYGDRAEMRDIFEALGDAVNKYVQPSILNMPDGFGNNCIQAWKYTQAPLERLLALADSGRRIGNLAKCSKIGVARNKLAAPLSKYLTEFSEVVNCE